MTDAKTTKPSVPKFKMPTNDRNIPADFDTNRAIVYMFHFFKKRIQDLQNNINPENAAKKRAVKNIKMYMMSDALADLLGWDKKEPIAQSRAFSQVSKYMDKHNLKNPKNKTKYTPNKEMRAVFAGLKDVTVDQDLIHVNRYLPAHLTAVPTKQ